MEALASLLIAMPDGSFAFNEAAWQAARIAAHQRNPFWKTVEDAARHHKLSDQEIAKVMAVAMLEANRALSERMQRLAEMALHPPIIVLPNGAKLH